MSEDRQRRMIGPRSGLKKLRDVFLEPKNQTQLLELLHGASEREIIDADALPIVESALKLAHLQAHDIMLPRPQVFMISADALPEETLKVIVETNHSRFPVIDHDRDDVIGVLLTKDLLAAIAETKSFEFDLRNLVRPVLFVPEKESLTALLREFRGRRNHMAIVQDEYGGVAGIVTIEDVLEQIVGDIEDEHDVIESMAIVQRDEKSYTIKALTPVHDFNTQFDVQWSEDDFDTVGGHVVNQYGHLPERGDQITIDNFEFTVLNADNRRIHILKMTVLDPTEPEDTVSE